MWVSIKNSAILLVINVIIATPIHIVVAYSIFRNIPGAKFYKIMLFLDIYPIGKVDNSRLMN